MSDETQRTAALIEALGLKEVRRAGWGQVGVDGAESVADHSWGVAMLALALCPPELDLSTVLRLALIHDLPEVRVGDITPRDHVSPDDKRQQEAQAATALLGGWPVLLDAWREYEEGTTAAARFVHQLDALDMGLQAHRYRDRGVDLSEFHESALQRLTDPRLRKLVSAPE
jgi:putative hydrolases of HD superfamily